MRYWIRRESEVLGLISREKGIEMKVLHITPVFYPNVGGVEVFVKNLATLQKKVGLDVRVLCLIIITHQ